MAEYFIFHPAGWQFLFGVISMTLTKAQQFCKEVKELALKYDLPFFVVTEGASATQNKNCEAVANARQAHIKWEKENDIDPNHSWE